MISIVVPVFNEEESIGKVICDLKASMADSGHKYEIIVVDDGSTDKTSELVEGKDINVLHGIRNKGYGAALKKGITYSSGDFVAIIDGDGTYSVKELSVIINLALKKGYDMVVGSRAASKLVIPIMRKFAKWFITRLACYLSNYDIPDINSGMRVMRKDVLKKFMPILPDGFSFTTTITLAMLTNGYSVKYLPVDYYKRSGSSKIIPIKDTINFMILIIRTIMYFNPLKVFLPFSLFLFLGAFVLMAFRIFAGRGFMVTSVVLFGAAFQIFAIGMLADLIDKRWRI